MRTKIPLREHYTRRRPQLDRGGHLPSVHSVLVATFLLLQSLLVSGGPFMHPRLATQRVYSFISFYSCSHSSSGKGARNFATCLNIDHARRKGAPRPSLPCSGVHNVCRVHFLRYSLFTQLPVAQISCVCVSTGPKGSLRSSGCKEGCYSRRNKEDILCCTSKRLPWLRMGLTTSTRSWLASIIRIRILTKVPKRSSLKSRKHTRYVILHVASSVRYVLTYCTRY